MVIKLLVVMSQDNTHRPVTFFVVQKSKAINKIVKMKTMIKLAPAPATIPPKIYVRSAPNLKIMWKINAIGCEGYFLGAFGSPNPTGGLSG
jgi:hypothetical protein